MAMACAAASGITASARLVMSSVDGDVCERTSFLAGASAQPSASSAAFGRVSFDAGRKQLVRQVATKTNDLAGVFAQAEGGKKKVVIAAPKKQRVLLRFLWLEKNIGIAIDQVVPGHGTLPLSPYFFWPRKDAWEQLKAKLDSKGWISRKRTIILLNQATDIINLWQQNAANL